MAASPTQRKPAHLRHCQAAILNAHIVRDREERRLVEEWNRQEAAQNTDGGDGGSDPGTPGSATIEDHEEAHGSQTTCPPC